jgi:septal ring factor EnvC (AmiA/AmiB activator)
MIGFAILSLCISQSSYAKTAEELRQVEQQLEQQKQQADELDAKARETSASLQDLRQRLITAAANYQAKAEEQENLEDKLDQLTQDIDVKNKALRDEKHKLNLLTDALIELSRQPPETWFLQTGLTSDHIHRAILLRAALPHLKEQTETYVRDLASLNDLQVQLAEQKHLAIAAQENLQGQQHDLDQLIKARQGLLQRTEAQKEAISAQLVSLSSEAKDLRQLLDKVTPKHAPKSAPPSGLTSSLKPPVAGTLAHPYGARDADGVISQGLTYSALPGSPVVAPMAGKVVFAGPFRGYGQILILQHAGGYHSFLAGFGRIDAEMGQEVGKGEPLGVLPVKRGSKPELYFEWRRNNEAIDPTAGIALSKSE